MKRHNKLLRNKRGLQLSGMMIGLLLTVAITLGFFTWISDGINKYQASPPADYNQSFLLIQGISGNLSSTIDSSYSELQNVSSQTASNNGGVFDFFSFYLSSGLRAARTATQSVTSSFQVADVAITNIPLGDYGTQLKGLFFLGILVTFIIGILLNFYIKSGRE